MDLEIFCPNKYLKFLETLFSFCKNNFKYATLHNYSFIYGKCLLRVSRVQIGGDMKL